MIQAVGFAADDISEMNKRASLAASTVPTDKSRILKRHIMRIGAVGYLMARFSFITCGTLVLLAALGVAQAQTRPVSPAPRPIPNSNAAQAAP